MKTKPREFWLDIIAVKKNEVAGDIYLQNKYEDLVHVIEAAPVIEKISRLEAALSIARTGLLDLEFWSCTACDENKLVKDYALKNSELDAILKPEQDATPGETKEQG